ncbi:kinase-like domain-containing protein [Suillus subaureus]|uniref:Kinase-like domain-containing protein n=1 Tax=Suillus subaureus TaxID=48587 RepID=A0A9P7DHS9_9AGAM|nr:kinase-like domain-containing protein [Suillus subaureus]KAG1794073.1 kinase-like domain-containing protein [Suillus subaureus]
MASLSTADESTLTPVLTLKGHKDTIASISYFPDGKRMISMSRDKTTRQWDLLADQEIKGVRNVHRQEVSAVGVSKDGRWIVTASGNLNTGELKVCQVETGIVRTSKGHSYRINCIDISGDNTLLACGAEDKTVRIWNLETGRSVAGPFQSAKVVGVVQFSRDSKKLAVKQGNYLEVWDIRIRSLDVKGTFDMADSICAPVFWTTKDETIVTAVSVTRGSPYTICELDASTLVAVGIPFEGHASIITGLALSLDCALLASASYNNIQLWSFESRQLLASFDVVSVHHLILSPDSRQLVYTTQHNYNIYLCNTPPEILASIQPVAQVRISSPIDLPLTDSCATYLIANQSTNEAPPNPRYHLPSHSLLPPPTSFAHRRAGPSWTDSYAGTSRIQPTDMQPLTDMWQWPADTQSSSAEIWGQQNEPGFQPLRQDTVHLNGGPTADLPSATISPVIVFPPPSQVPSSTVGPPLPQLRPNAHELLPSSSYMYTAFSARNHELHGLPPEAMLQNLTRYITKDEYYPTARGGFGEIWKCTYQIDRRSIKVAVKALQMYTADQLGATKEKKIKRIKRELRICANLKHANILPVYGYTYGFGPFLAIVSPWAEGGNLTVYLEREGAALTLARRFQLASPLFLRDIIAGLQYLHANSVIHGDFTGPNVLIHGDGTACVADFGLSLMYSEIISASQASWTSTLKGNMRWMAPELLVPEREDGSPTRPSEQSDIFSFGGIMLQVLTNKIPYYYLPNDAAIVLCIARSEKPSRARYSELSEQYWTLMEQCWSTDPRDRPSTKGVDAMIGNEFYSLSRSR